MRKLISFFMLAFVVACNNSKKDPAPATESNSTVPSTQENTTTPVPSNPASGSTVTYTVEGTEISNHASLLVSKDKDNLQPGTPFLCLLTSNNAAHDGETISLNFLLDTKPGTYPVVGSSLMRGKDPNNQMFGGILGGKPTLTDYKVNITECTDLGSNTMGGHKWSISGHCDEIKIKASRFMLLDKSKNHPEEITIQNIHFANLTFDDNLEEMMEKAMDQMKKKN